MDRSPVDQLRRRIASALGVAIPQLRVAAPTSPDFEAAAAALRKADGRPFVVDGDARTAELVAQRELELELELEDFEDELPPEVREQLAAHWAGIARAEHASVASFARFTSQLMSVGAPPQLVVESLAAADDEVRHAEAALELAEAFAGRGLEFGPLDVDAAVAEACDLEQLTLACVSEGCIGETLSTLELATIAARCSDLGLAELLQSIADDEARHAALAWMFVRWALQRDPTLNQAVTARFEALARAHVGAGAVHSAEPYPEILVEHGCLPADERERVIHEGVLELVLPCARALLDESAVGNERGC
ncbi:hypothetical protein G6O69_06010 [Pseudenhygromyxa sp. WMMC2535]|uniref:hypothetical protein n=1 Tax=Pseudenhygromyxa sp. WMMC2535 TaxID=2712867 RepID=UPI001556D979|nr:hypothetical protein [Pseudenhygromyxa sp. WMMC2535]NVB37378.1 hypothetical protein [Pseudenhygromyxa sp. WMMC2535]